MHPFKPLFPASTKLTLLTMSVMTSLDYRTRACPQTVQERVRPLVDRLLEDRVKALRSPMVFSEFCHGLAELGVPVERATIHMPQIHPQLMARSMLWLPETGGAVETGRRHGIESSNYYLASPIRQIYEGAPAIRRTLADPNCPMDFPILEELKVKGFADYFIVPLSFSVGGRPNALSFSTRQSEGFQNEDLCVIETALPAFGAVMELQHLQRTARTLLATYVGPTTGEKVLSGAVRRGDGEIINAVLWYCDLRNFTEMSENLPPDQMIGLLNDYFEVMAQPVKGRGGEILKFIGDAMLAIFPLEPQDRGPCMACCNGLLAAQEAVDGIAALNERRGLQGLTPLRAGVSLARGDVMYGNIGDSERLDFTVIGPAVNLATRLEDLTRDLDPPIVFSRDIAEGSDRATRSLGFFPLKGIAEPQEAFTLI